MSLNKLFELYPPPWVADDNREGREGLVTVYAANGAVVICTGDMEGCTWDDILLAHLIAAAPQMYALLGETDQWLLDYIDYADTVTNARDLKTRIAEVLLQADHDRAEALRFPPDPNAPPPISIIPPR